MSQTFVNLDTGDIYDSTDQLKSTKEYKGGLSFCWARSQISPDGNTLVVSGCIWGGPYEYKFYDFTDPSTGWPELETDDFYYEDGHKKSEWSEDGYFNIYESTEYINYNGQKFDTWSEEYFNMPNEDITEDKYVYETEQKRVVKREHNKIVTVSLWKSDKRIDEETEREKAEKENKRLREQMENDNELYQKIKKNLQQPPYHIYGGYMNPYFRLYIANFKSDDLTTNELKKQCEIVWHLTNGPIVMKFWICGKGNIKEKEYLHELNSITEILDDINNHLDK